MAFVKLEPREATAHVAQAEFSAGDSLGQFVEFVPTAFAVTRGPAHALVYANAAFRHLTAADGDSVLGRPLTHAFKGSDMSKLTAVLDRVFRNGLVARDCRIEPGDEIAPHLSCTVWPEVHGSGESLHLVIELYPPTQAELSVGLQREVAERLLLSALRERDAAEVAEASRLSAAFLAAESRRLDASLDENATLVAMASMSLPSSGGWCVVDILDHDNTMHRLAIVHPDPSKQDLVRDLEGRWSPEPGGLFGAPAMLRSAKTTVVADDSHDPLFGTAYDRETLRILRALGVGPLLTVPLVIRERLVGAVTFVAGHGRPFTSQDVELAEDLASRSALALDRARLYRDAIALKSKAESASQAKSEFLGALSHELRTPLSAIGGYVEIIDMGLHGPVTKQQHADLARIQASQFHLVGLIEDLLNFTKLGSGQLSIDVSDVIVHDALVASVALVEPLLSKRQLVIDGIACGSAIVASADAEKLRQILLNLLSNAIKFTATGGRIAIECATTNDAVSICVSDTGIGIPSDKLEAIFEPFVQVKSGLASRDRGVGLGLAISRGLARAMNGDLTVESALGKGTRFTLTLPRACCRDDRGC
jgi:signal transduction histidine kinase